MMEKCDLIKLYIAVVCMAVVVHSCGNRVDRRDSLSYDRKDNIVEDAGLLRIYPFDDYDIVEVVNPWNTTKLLATYVLSEDSVDVTLPGGARPVFVRVPLRRALVYSSVHAGVVDEFGCAGAIAGVADGSYFKLPSIVDGLRSGTVTDVGSSMSPSLEKITAIHPDAILLSPFENTGHGAIENIGVPIIECAGYMEASPLGRAEWSRFLSILFRGRRANNDSLFREVKNRYIALRDSATSFDDRPKVLTEMLTDGYWFVPGGRSYAARLIEDAGAEYPWADNKSAGSLQLDFSAVFAKAADVDYWLIKTYGYQLTLKQLEEVYPYNAKFRPFQLSLGMAADTVLPYGVFAANTAVVPLYEEFPFHPDLLLEEYISIFHPSVFSRPLRYYQPVR